MMKVDHADEHGAIFIHSGQLFIARLFVLGMVGELKEFFSHECRHRTVSSKSWNAAIIHVAAATGCAGAVAWYGLGH